MNNWNYFKYYTCHFIPVPNCSRQSLGTLQTRLPDNQGGEQIRKVSFSHIISSFLSSISSLQFYPQLCSRLLTCCGLSSLCPIPSKLSRTPCFFFSFLWISSAPCLVHPIPKCKFPTPKNFVPRNPWWPHQDVARILYQANTVTTHS